MLIGIFLFLLAIAGSLISQNPPFVENGTMQWLKYLWFFPLVFQLLIDSKAFVELWCRQVLFVILCFVIFCLIGEIFTFNSYIGLDLTNILMSVTVAIVSFSLWRKYGRALIMKILCVMLVLVGSYLAYAVYSQYLVNASILDLQYSFDSKNSMGQILLCCGFIPLANFIPKQFLLKYAYYALVLFIFVVMIWMKSRATMASGLFILIYLFVKSNNLKLKLVVLSLCVLFCFVVILTPDLYEIIVTGIVLANRAEDNLDDLSSGRVFLISEAIEYIQENLLIGIGNHYIDCMPIAMLLQYGVIGSSIVFLLIVVVGYHLMKMDVNHNSIKRTAFLLFFAFLINSLFEAQPPFGPGAKCFLMWMMVGFAFAESPQKKVCITS